MTIKIKQCTKCGKLKSLSLFNPRSDNPEKYRSECKKCQYKAQHRGRKRSAERARAYNRLHYAVKTGNIVKPKRCEDCGKVKLLGGHHKDYSKSFEVEWLCGKCHCKADKSFKIA